MSEDQCQLLRPLCVLLRYPYPLFTNICISRITFIVLIYRSAGLAVNVTYFCGVIQDTTADMPLKDGVVSETKSGGLVVKVKFCQGDFCNAANFQHIPFFLIFVSFAVLLLLR